MQQMLKTTICTQLLEKWRKNPDLPMPAECVLVDVPKYRKVLEEHKVDLGDPQQKKSE